MWTAAAPLKIASMTASSTAWLSTRRTARAPEGSRCARTASKRGMSASQVRLSPDALSRARMSPSSRSTIRVSASIPSGAKQITPSKRPSSSGGKMRRSSCLASRSVSDFCELFRLSCGRRKRKVSLRRGKSRRRLEKSPARGKTPARERKSPDWGKTPRGGSRRRGAGSLRWWWRSA